MHVTVKRIARTSVVAALLFFLSGAAMAWEVNWLNHRRVHYSIDNRTNYDLTIDSTDASCTSAQPPVLLAPANKISAHADWEWKFTTGCAPAITVRVSLTATGAGRACEIVFKTNNPFPIGPAGETGVAVFSATPNIGANCQIKQVNTDPKAPKDSVVIVVHGAMKPYNPTK